jgi:hypothetical protein
LAVLDADPTVGVAYCAKVLDDGFSDGKHPTRWPSALSPGRHESVYHQLLSEEWFLLPSSSLWRRELWSGPAAHWSDLRCADLQFFLSVALDGWAFYYLEAPLAHFNQHSGQLGSSRQPDHGLAMADDVLAFWDRWLKDRPPQERTLNARVRANWHLRRALALLLSGRLSEARADIEQARQLGGSDLPNLRRLAFAALLPTPLVQGGVAIKRAVQRLKL